MSLLVFVLALTALLPDSTASQLRQWKPQDDGRTHVDSPKHALSAYHLARDILQGRWSSAWHDELPCGGPTYKGFVPKTGSGSQSTTLRAKRKDTGVFVKEKLPVYEGCQVFISHKWRFIYIRQPKSSSSAIIAAIKLQLCGLPGDHLMQDCAEDEFRFATDEETNSNLWEEYFVFTFVRNPWTRMRSAYGFLQGWLRRKDDKAGEPGDECGLSFEKFTEDTNAMRQLCPKEQCCTYIDHLQKWSPYFPDVHLGDQAHCVFLPGGESLVDFIGASESINEDWVAVVEEINKRAGTSFEAATVAKTNVHEDSSEQGLASCAGDKFDENTLYQIASQYSMDIIKFGYM